MRRLVQRKLVKKKSKMMIKASKPLNPQNSRTQKEN